MTHEELLAQARAHWVECAEDPAEVENRRRGREDARFAAGCQWDEQTKRDREADRRPALVFNRMGGFLHQLENEVRQNRIGITISPVDDGIDKDTAEVDQGLVRQIQYDSKADAAVHGAFVEACRTALGAFTLRAEYCADDSFDQDLKIEQIPDAIHRVYWDPCAKQADKSDARYWFEVDTLPLEEFKRQYPDSETAATNFFDSGFGTFDHDWITKDGVRVANYWYVETKKRKLLLLNSGQTVFADEIDGELPEGVTVQKDRIVFTRTVKCAKINGEEVLDEFEWRGSSIPIFPVLGEELFVDGRRKRFSLIHFAQDPQRLLNYYRSSEAEVIGLMPKAPWIVAEGQVEGYERMWQTANRVSYGALPYKPTTVGDHLVPPPQRNAYEAPIQALSLGAAQAVDDMKASMAMYDASLGNRSNETSGVAIQARKLEGDLANFHFIDNLARAICACGRAIVEVRPHYYDTARMIRILGEDEKPKVVRINEPYLDEKGVERHYKLSEPAKYDVRVSTGPSYTSLRQEAWAQMTEWVRGYPELMKIAGDIMFRQSDLPGAELIADRIKGTLPPELAEDNEAQAVPPKVEAQMKALAQQNEQLAAALNEASSGEALKRMEIDSKERIAALQARKDVLINLAKLGSAEAIALLREELAAIDRLSSPEPEAGG